MAGGGPAAMWQWQNNNGTADPALTPTTESVDMLSMLGNLLHLLGSGYKPTVAHLKLASICSDISLGIKSKEL